MCVCRLQTSQQTRADPRDPSQPASHPACLPYLAPMPSLPPARCPPRSPRRPNFYKLPRTASSCAGPAGPAGPRPAMPSVALHSGPPLAVASRRTRVGPVAFYGPQSIYEWGTLGRPGRAGPAADPCPASATHPPLPAALWTGHPSASLRPGPALPGKKKKTRGKGIGRSRRKLAKLPGRRVGKATRALSRALILRIERGAARRVFSFVSVSYFPLANGIITNF